VRLAWRRAALVVALTAAAARAVAQATVAVSAPATLAPGEPALVRVEVTAPATADVRLAPPDVAPFTVARAGRVPAVDGGAARGWRRYEWRYVLAPPDDARGRFEFAPFTAEVKGPGLRPWSVRSRPWALVVRAPAPPAAGGTVPLASRSRAAGGRVSPGAAAARNGVTFRARVFPDRVYVGEQATYELTVTVDAAARARIRRNPEFVPPELRGVLSVDLPASHEATAQGDVHVYRRALFALSPGAVVVPSARLSYALALGTSYFSPEERLALRTEPVRFSALAAPRAGRPGDWDGAVGTLHASARAAAPSVRAGDPVEFTVRIAGAANVGLLPRPALAIPWADVVETTDRVEIDSGAPVVRGAKEFTWLVTPRRTGAFATPALRYAYFDPARRTYDAVVVPPVAIEARGGAGQGTDDDARMAASANPPPSPRPDRLAVRATWRGAFGRPLPSTRAFWLLVALAPAPAALVVAARAARHRRRSRPTDPARAFRAGNGPTEPRALRRAVNAAFAARVGFEPTTCTGSRAFARALRRVGVTDGTAARAAALVESLDAAAFDGLAPRAARDLATDAREILSAVDREAQGRHALGGPPVGADARGRRDHGSAVVSAAFGLVLASGAVLGACTLARPAHRLERTPASAVFARGVEAYARGDVAAARAAFVGAAALEPAAPDGWANAGTAAWAAADTAAAAIAWQRALRLEPTARDMRDRLALLPAAQDGWIAGVVPVDPDWLAGAAGLLAVAAGALALRAAMHPLGSGRAWLWLWGAALGTGAMGAGLVAHVDPARRAVVVAGGPLRTEPSLVAEPGPPADRSDVARVAGRQGSWTRVALDGGRDGWIENDRLAPLDAPARATIAGPGHAVDSRRAAPTRGPAPGRQ
jgi:hypothetical protein